MPLRPKKPGHVHSNEPDRVNLGYFNLSKENSRFRPVRGVPYLWVMRHDGDLVVGVEEPWKYPEAFNVDPDAEWWKDLCRQLELKHRGRPKGRLGHPTLGARFRTTEGRTGVADVGGGYVLLGGELKHDGRGWVIDDDSGRFGQGDARSRHVTATLREVAQKFYALAHLHVRTQLVRDRVQPNTRAVAAPGPEQSGSRPGPSGRRRKRR